MAKGKPVPHRFDKKLFNWRYCSQCGLVALKNERTRRAMKKPCYREDK